MKNYSRGLPRKMDLMDLMDLALRPQQRKRLPLRQPSTGSAMSVALDTAMTLPIAAPSAVPDSIAEAELADGSTIWLVLDADNNELSRHLTEEAAHAVATAALKVRQP